MFVLLNQGNGTFSNPVGYNAGGVGRVVPTDVNGDSILDLVVAAYESQTIEILRGQGNGTFAARVPYSALGYPYSVVVADLENDGDKDIICADKYRLAVLENSGSGSFGPVVGSAPSVQLASTVLRSADVNLDGFMDLITGTTTGIKVALGQNNGGFGPILTSPINSPGNPNPNDVRNIALGDMNGDGKLDLVIWDGAARLIVQINQGNGLFSSTYWGNIPNGGRINKSPLSLGDFDNDGFLDVAFANTYALEIIAYHRWAERVVVNVFRGNGNGTLTPQSEQLLTEMQWDCAFCPAPVGKTTSLTSGDFNGDGLVDLAIFGGDWGGIYTVLNQGNGQFVRDYGPIPGSHGAYYSLETSSNGPADLVVSDGVGLQLLRNSGNGNFIDGGSFWGSVSDVVLVDLDGDGVKDIAASGNGTNSARVLRQQGNNGLGDMLDYAAGFTPISIAAGDFDRDGKMDLAVQNRSPASVSILYNSCLP